MILLALESSAESSSVAIWQNSKLLSYQIIEAKFGHAERIITQVHKALKQAKLDLDEIDFFVGGRGPGSFTGIRTCLAAITGFSIATGKGYYGVNGLSALGFSCYNKLTNDGEYNDKIVIFAITDTRRGSYYCQEFNQEIKVQNNIEDLSLEHLQIKVNYLIKSGYIVKIYGPFAKRSDMFNCDKGNASKVQYFMEKLNAAHIANYAAWQLQNKGQCSPATPLYLAPPIIKRQINN